MAGTANGARLWVRVCALCWANDGAPTMAAGDHLIPHTHAGRPGLQRTPVALTRVQRRTTCNGHFGRSRPNGPGPERLLFFSVTAANVIKTTSTPDRDYWLRPKI